MSLILVSFQSALNWKGAMGIFDPETGLRYLQIDAPSSIVNNSQPRGVAAIKNRIYVNTFASIRIYQLDHRKNKPLLKLEKEVILKEWLLGDAMQARLVPIVASEERNRLYIGNNNFCSIDELDLEGSFIRRQHLWEIAPDIFSLPNHAEEKIVYGRIRNLCLSPSGILCITVANCNNSGTGKVISLDTGEELIAGLHDPYDGLFTDSFFYLHDIDESNSHENKHNGKLYAYRIFSDRGDFIDGVQWAVHPEMVNNEFKSNIQNLRGMVFTGDTLFCGVSHHGKAAGLRFPPRIVSFDAVSGIQQREYLLPDLKMFRQPRVLFMTALDENFTVQWGQDLHFYLHEQPTKPEYYQEEEKKESENAQSGNTIPTEKNGTLLEVSAPPPSVKSEKSFERNDVGKSHLLIEDVVTSGETNPSKNAQLRDTIPTEKNDTRLEVSVAASPVRPEKFFESNEKGKSHTLSTETNSATETANTEFPAAPATMLEKNKENATRSVDNDEGIEWIKRDKIKVPSIILENVSLNYRRMASFTFLSRNKHLGKTTDFLAVDDLSFTIYENETVGIIGRNGSGKSTVSMIICGALPPDAGKVKVKGKVQLLALGVGFRPELTGRENVVISGTLLGMTRREVASKMEDIEEFAELGEFFDEPLRIYSSGMRSRLGFAVATAVNPDILILDEVMSTGDAAFRNKADQRMQAMRQRTKTVLMVSHSADQVKNLCSRVVWLEKGRLIMDGPAVPILAEYNKFCKNPGKWLDSKKNASLPLAAY